MEDAIRRKSKTSTAVKQKYLHKTYDMISVRIPKETAHKFKTICSTEGISQADIFKKAIETVLKQYAE